MSRLNFMIDLETLDLKPSSVIASIGAICFNREEILEKWYRNIYLPSQQINGRTVDVGTVLWWMKQDKEAQADTFFPQEKPDTLRDALADMAGWMRLCFVNWTDFGRNMTWESTDEMDFSREKDVSVWANGIDFDLGILTHAYAGEGLDLPWGFRQQSDYRTLARHFGVSGKRIGTHHNALDDAEWAATNLINFWKSNDNVQRTNASTTED